MAKLSRLAQITFCITVCVTSYIGLLCRMQVLFSDNQVLPPSDVYPVTELDPMSILPPSEVFPVTELDPMSILPPSDVFPVTELDPMSILPPSDVYPVTELDPMSILPPSDVYPVTELDPMSILPPSDVYPVTELDPMSDDQSPTAIDSASEHVQQVDSEHVPRGDSEHVPRGDSEHVPRGDSEHVPRGDSEHVPQGDSEHVPRGDFEHVPRGDFEHVPRGDSEHVPRGDTILGLDSTLDVKHQNENLGLLGRSSMYSEESDESTGLESSHAVGGSHRTVHFATVGGDLYVYGAFLDLRQKRNHTIRLLVLRHRNHRDSLVCSVSDGVRRVTLYPQAYKMCENHGKPFEGWIYSCTLPSAWHVLPGDVTVMPQSERGHSSEPSASFNLHTIPAETSDLNRDNIGVCVPPLFGDLSLAAIIHFLQMCKLLGADRLFLYLANVSSEIRTFLLYHSQNDASLSVVDWELPGNVSASTDKIWYHGQLLAIQDCLYTNMASFRYLLFMDLDEMLVPRVSRDWPAMLRKIFTREDRASVAALSFQSAFFDPTRMPEDSETILYFQHLYRTSFSKVRNKLLVQPLKVFELGIHHLSKAMSEEGRSVNVSESVASLHHYQACVQSYEPDMKCFHTREDRTMLRYKQALTHLSHRVITDASRLFA